MEKIILTPSARNGFYHSEVANLASLFEGETGYRMLAPEAARASPHGELENRVMIAASPPLADCFFYKGMGSVLIVFGPYEEYYGYADIVIDGFQEVSAGVFSGRDFQVSRERKPMFADIFALYKRLQWDSDFFQFGVAFLTSRYLTENIARLVNLGISDQRDIRLIEYLCNCHDAKSVTVAERENFHFVDIRLTFENDLSRSQEDSSNRIPSGYSINKAVEADIPELEKMADSLYLDSRYYFDSNFEQPKVNEFYLGWLRKAVRGQFDDYCYVLRGTTGIPLAFCTIREDLNATVNIGLVGANSGNGFKGMGSVLLEGVLSDLRKEGWSKVVVVTQGRNYRAQRLYQRNGFLTRKTELWYHKWV
jgi:hypothetical protein